MSETRRVAKFEITPQLLIQTILSADPIQPDGALCWFGCDLPADVKILHAEWNFVTCAITVVCESQEFPEVTAELGTIPEMPYRTVLCHSHYFSAEELIQMIEARRAGNNA